MKREALNAKSDNVAVVWHIYWTVSGIERAVVPLLSHACSHILQMHTLCRDKSRALPFFPRSACHSLGRRSMMGPACKLQRMTFGCIPAPLTFHTARGRHCLCPTPEADSLQTGPRHTFQCASKGDGKADHVCWEEEHGGQRNALQAYQERKMHANSYKNWLYARPPD